MKRYVLLLAALPSLAGCTKMGPDFARPDAWWKPDSWLATAPATPAPRASVPVAEPFDYAWWKLLGDPLLNEMQEQLATANLDLRTADFRLVQARAQLGITEAATTPSMNANASYARQQFSRNGPNSGSRLRNPFNVFQFGLDLSWEVDLWGRVARLVEASEAQVAASEEARRDLTVVASAELARSYLTLRGVQRKTVCPRLMVAQTSCGVCGPLATGLTRFRVSSMSFSNVTGGSLVSVLRPRFSPSHKA